MLSRLIEQCFDLTSSLLENDQWGLIEHFMRVEVVPNRKFPRGDSEGGDSDDGSEATYARFADLLTGLLNDLLSKDAQKLGLLVDDIVSSVYKHRNGPKRANLKPFVLEKIGSLLRNTRVLGMERFQAQLQLAESCKQHREKQCWSTDVPSFPSFSLLTGFNARWVCRMIESPPHFMNPYVAGGPSPSWCTEYCGRAVPSSSPLSSKADVGETIQLNMHQYSSEGVGIWVHFEIALLQPKHQQKRSFGLQSFGLQRPTSPRTSSRTRLQVQVTLSKGSTAFEPNYGGIDFTQRLSPEERYQSIPNWTKQLEFAVTYDRHLASQSVPVNLDGRPRIPSATACSISRDSDGEGELSATM